jgi:hypothetical protein
LPGATLLSVGLDHSLVRHAKRVVIDDVVQGPANVGEIRDCATGLKVMMLEDGRIA